MLGAVRYGKARVANAKDSDNKGDTAPDDAEKKDAVSEKPADSSASDKTNSSLGTDNSTGSETTDVKPTNTTIGEIETPLSSKPETSKNIPPVLIIAIAAVAAAVGAWFASRLLKWHVHK